MRQQTLTIGNVEDNPVRPVVVPQMNCSCKASEPDTLGIKSEYF